MDTGLLYACKGEVFKRVAIYKDRVECQAEKETVILMGDEIDCIRCNGKACQDTTCTYFINCLEFDNCTISVNRSMTLEEIGDIYGVSREMIRQDEERALNKARKIIKKLYGFKQYDRVTSADFLPNSPWWEPIATSKKASRRRARAHIPLESTEAII